MVYVFLAEGFEEIEALTVVDVLRRYRIIVSTVGVHKKNIKGAHDIEVIADIEINDIKLDDDLHMVVLPGGMLGASNLGISMEVLKCLDYMNENNRYMAAICAAPGILGQKKFLFGKRAVCYPGLEENLLGAIVVGDDVCVDDNIITAKDMKVSLQFADTLVDLLIKGEQY